MKKKTYKKYMNELYKSIIITYDDRETSETWASMSINQKGIKGRRFKKILNNPIIQDSIDLGFGNIPNPSGSLADPCDFNIFIGKVEFINPHKKYCIFMRQHNPNYGYTNDSDYKTWIEIRRMDKLPYEKHVHIDKFYPRWTNVTENNKGTKFKRMEMSNRLIYKKLRRYCKYPHKIPGSLLISAANDFRIPDSWETTNELGYEAFLTSTGIYVPVCLLIGIKYEIKCDKDRDYVISIENNCVYVKEA